MTGPDFGRRRRGFPAGPRQRLAGVVDRPDTPWSVSPRTTTPRLPRRAAAADGPASPTSGLHGPFARWLRTAHPDVGVTCCRTSPIPPMRPVCSRGHRGAGYLSRTGWRLRRTQRRGYQVAGGGTVWIAGGRGVAGAAPFGRRAEPKVRVNARSAELATEFQQPHGGPAAGVSQRAVEKHINSIFAKLGLTVDDSVDRRSRPPDVPRRRRVGMSMCCASTNPPERWCTTLVRSKRSAQDDAVDEPVRVVVVDDQASFPTGHGRRWVDGRLRDGRRCETGETAVELMRDGDAPTSSRWTFTCRAWAGSSRAPNPLQRPDLVVVHVHLRSRGPAGRGQRVRRRGISALEQLSPNC